MLPALHHRAGALCRKYSDLHMSVLERPLKADGNAICNTVQQLSGAVGTAAAAAFVSMSQLSMPGEFSFATGEGTGRAFLFLLALSVLQFLLLFFSFDTKRKG